jgi:hypothetical protein
MTLNIINNFKLDWLKFRPQYHYELIKLHSIVEVFSIYSHVSKNELKRFIIKSINLISNLSITQENEDFIRDVIKLSLNTHHIMILINDLVK